MPPYGTGTGASSAGSCSDPLPLPQGLDSEQLCSTALWVGGRDTVRCGRQEGFRVSIWASDTQSSLWPQNLPGSAFWKPLPGVSSGEEEGGFQTDFHSSVRSPAPRLIRSGCICIFTYLPDSSLTKVILIKNADSAEMGTGRMDRAHTSAPGFWAQCAWPAGSGRSDQRCVLLPSLQWACPREGNEVLGNCIPEVRRQAPRWERASECLSLGHLLESLSRLKKFYFSITVGI